MFSSSRFYNEKNKRVSYTVNNTVYEIDENSEKIKATSPAGKPVRIIDFSITKNVVLILFGILLMIIVFVNMAKSYKKQSIPSGVGRL